MLAPLVLPLQITVAIFAVVWIGAALVLKTPKRMASLTLAAMLLFIPSCAGIMAIVDAVRYGRFDYPSAADIPRDGYIELPESAVKIALYRHASGHRARFSIDTESLRTWIDERRSQRPDLNHAHDDDEWTASTDQSPDGLRLKQEIFSRRFPDTGWLYDPKLVELHVSRSDRGGGYTVWHNPASGDTYLSAAYW